MGVGKITLTSGAVRTNQTGAGLALEGIHDLEQDRKIRHSRVLAAGRSGTNANLVGLRNAFGDAHNERNFVLDGFNDSICSSRRGDVEDGSIRFCLLDGLSSSGLTTSPMRIQGAPYLLNSAKDGESEVCLAGLLW